ncbi:MAG TPA: AMP-binding protein, partial [Acidiferrobacterales bacterium]|nr:AMP-binding protein [Acidiferrobacterales bacterium]
MSTTLPSTSYHHRGGEIPLLGVTIPAHIALVAAKYPEREAVVCVQQQRRLTYAQLMQAMDQLARGLLGSGFQKGERIGVWSTNNIEWLLLQLATARIGAVLVNINPAYRPRELAYALQKSEVQGLFSIPAFRTSDYVGMLAELIPELKAGTPTELQSKDFPQLRRIALFDPVQPQKTARPHPGFLLWQEVIAAGATVTDAQLDAATQALDIDDPINIQYTSGTTGFPKGVVLTHHNILNNGYFIGECMKFTENDRLCIPV